MQKYLSCLKSTVSQDLRMDPPDLIPILKPDDDDESADDLIVID